ncbi:hypothetical protein BH10PSE16_BH10PSE16_03070 [soil metagenome]
MAPPLSDEVPTRTVLPPPPTALTSRQVAVFILGLLLGAVVVAGAWMLREAATSPAPFMPETGMAPPQPVAQAAQQLQFAPCPMQPTVAPADGKDGQFPLQSDVSGLIAADIGSFMLLGKEAAVAGRPRDAEVALLMSCRVADKLKGGDSVESADARYQLGAHYARLALEGAAAGSAAASHTELLERAQRLYADSLQAYVAHYGETHEKSQLATQGLAAVKQAQADTVQPAPEKPAPKTAAKTAASPEPARPARQGSARPFPPASRPRPHQAQVAKAAAEPKKPEAATPSGPSFNCAKARSVTEKFICADPELAQLDRELGRLHARARTATSHPAAFRQRSEQEWLRRESTCQDRECLLRWYEHRRNELMDTIEGRE